MTATKREKDELFARRAARALRLPAVAIGLGAVLLLMPVPPAAADRINNPTAVFDGLDKITGRVVSFEVAIDETVQFGSLQVTPRACYTRPPTEAPQTISFVEIDEVSDKNEFKRVFGGWMFAASPALHALEHPIYDVWLTDCKGGNPEKDLVRTTASTSDSGSPAAPQDAQPPPPKPGTLPRPKRQPAQATGDATTLAGPPVPGGGAAAVTSQPLPAPARRPPTRRLFPANVTPPLADTP